MHTLAAGPPQHVHKARNRETQLNYNDLVRENPQDVENRSAAVESQFRFHRADRDFLGQMSCPSPAAASDQLSNSRGKALILLMEATTRIELV